MPRHYLDTYFRRFEKESNWLFEEFEMAVTALRVEPHDRSARLSAEMALIRLHDGWARFCREIVVVSAGGKAITASGNRLPLAPNISRIQDVIPVLLASYSKKRRYEPKWARPTETAKAIQLLKIANRSTVIAAIGATNSPAEEIRPLRNYLAHRGRNTAQEIRNQSIYVSRPKIIVEDLAGVYIPPGILRFESWVISLQQIAQAAIQ